MKRLASSYRDPSGYMFRKADELYRFVDLSYKDDYDLLMSSGLYDELTSEGMLIPHEEVDLDLDKDGLYKILKPELIPFVSYPYEWCFSQLKDAALLTLDIQKKALDKGMILKDATPYNVQFVAAKPVFIDTLSFEKYKEGQTWDAYKQFCEFFLATLMLMSKVDLGLNKLLRVYMNGIPLGLASSLLKAKDKVNFSYLIHVFMHSRSQSKYDDVSKFNKNKLNKGVSLHSLKALIESLEGAIRKLEVKNVKTEWGDYYEANNNYSDEAMEDKKNIIVDFMQGLEAERVLDLGANDGSFSRLAVDLGAYVVAMDIDELAVERNYRRIKQGQDGSVLPLCVDLLNPSPGLGFENSERNSLKHRSKSDLLMALALIHHLVISNNLRMEMIAEAFSSLGKHLIIEFVPKSDSQVEKLLTSRKDIFPNYSEDGFEEAFGKYFSIKDKRQVAGCDRTLYLMEVA